LRWPQPYDLLVHPLDRLLMVVSLVVLFLVA